MAEKLIFIHIISMLKKLKIRNDIEVRNRVSDDINKLVSECGFFNKTPFRIVSIYIHYTDCNDFRLPKLRVSSADGNLDVPFSLNIGDLYDIAKESPDKLYQAFHKAVLIMLIKVGNNYKIDASGLERALIVEYGINAIDETKRN